MQSLQENKEFRVSAVPNDCFAYYYVTVSRIFFAFLKSWCSCNSDVKLPFNLVLDSLLVSMNCIISRWLLQTQKIVNRLSFCILLCCLIFQLDLNSVSCFIIAQCSVAELQFHPDFSSAVFQVSSLRQARNIEISGLVLFRFCIFPFQHENAFICSHVKAQAARGQRRRA